MAFLSLCLPAFAAVLLNMEPPDGLLLGCNIPRSAPVVRTTQIASQESTDECNNSFFGLQPPFFKPFVYKFSTTPTSSDLKQSVQARPEHALEGHTKLFGLLEAPRATKIFNDLKMSEKNKPNFQTNKDLLDKQTTNKPWYDRVERNKEMLF